MQKPKRILCIMDMAFVGRSSMAAVLPVLSACGVQACPLPPLLLSTHTGGFGTLARTDVTVLCEEALQHYKNQKIEFDAIYVGYLAGKHQFDLAEHAIEQYPEAFVLVDPAMGDDGKAYTGIDNFVVERMRLLCTKANLITPNITECALLLGAAQPEQEKLCLNDWVAPLVQYQQTVVVTSAPSGGVWVKPWGKESFTVPVHMIPQGYPGTGDLFAAALLGLLSKVSLQQAVEKAVQFVGAAVHETYKGQGEPRHGVWFENSLPLLL